MTTIPDLRTLHRRALDAATGVLTTVTPADLDRATPCAGWDLRTLLGHMVGQNHGFAAAASGGDAPRTAYAHRPPDEWARSAAELAAAFADAPSGAEVVLVEIRPEPVPIAAAVGFQLLDTVVHTWDVATALGRAHRPDDELLAATAELARLVPTGAARERPDAAFAPAREPGLDDPWLATLAALGR